MAYLAETISSSFTILKPLKNKLYVNGTIFKDSFQGHDFSKSNLCSMKVCNSSLGDFKSCKATFC